MLSLIAGAVGLGLMAITGVGRHGHGGAGQHGGTHGHAGHGATGGHAAQGSGHHAGHAVGHAKPGHVGGSSFSSVGMRATTWMLMTPRLLFALLLGFGAAGLVLRSWFGGALLLGAAIVAGIAFERVLVNPMWNLALRFASNPAITLESAIQGEATAVSNFDRNGQGIIAVEVDGQVQQVLATLLPAEREHGIRIRAGQRVRVEEVDSERNRCSVSSL